MYKKKTVNVPIYKFGLNIILTDEINKVSHLIDDESVYAHAVLTSRTCHVILNTKENITFGIIAHEALHIANFIFEVIGVIPNFRDDEAQAYLLEWVVDKIIEFIYKECEPLCVK